MAKAPIDKLQARIRQLPPLPAVINRLMDVVQNKESSANDVSKVLASDQNLTSKVLRLVNSSFYGMSRKIATITRAVVILGYQAVRHLALGLAAYEAFKKEKSGLDRERFWLHSLSCAATAQLVAKQLGCPVPEEAFVSGLLHDIGRMAVSVACPQEFARLQPASAAKLIEQEKKILGMSHTQAGAVLLEYWRLPEHLCRVARFHHSARLVSASEEPLLTSIMLADALSSAENSDPLEKVDSAMSARVMSAVGIPAGEYGGILRDMSTHVARARVFLQVAEKAPGGESGTAADSAQEELPAVAVIGATSQRTEWVRSLLEHFGYRVQMCLPAEVGGLTSVSCGCAIVDAGELAAEALAEVCSALSAGGIGAALLDAGAEGCPAPEGCAKLPLVFSREDIEGLTR